MFVGPRGDLVPSSHTRGRRENCCPRTRNLPTNARSASPPTRTVLSAETYVPFTCGTEGAMPR
jgi:hypothetical protein